MKRYFAVVALVCALAGGLRAQNTSTFGNIVSQGTPCGASNCVYYQLPVGTPWVNVTVAGSWSGTLEIAATYAPNANYSNLSTIAWTALATETGNGTWSASTGGAGYNGTWLASAGGAVYLRVRATSWATGTAQVTMNSAQSPANNPILPGQVTATELVANDAAVGGIKLLCIATSNNGSAYSCDTTPIYTPVTTETTIELLPDVASNAGEVSLSVNGSSPFDISTVGTSTGPVTDPGAGGLRPLTPVFMTLQFAQSGFFFYWTAPAAAAIPPGSGTQVSLNSGSAQSALAITGFMPQKCVDTTGSSTAQACTTAVTFTPQTNNSLIYQAPTNSGAEVGHLTLEVNGSGAKSIAVPGPTGWTTSFPGGAWFPTTPMILIDDGTNWDATGAGIIPGGYLPGFELTTNGAALNYDITGGWVNCNGTQVDVSSVANQVAEPDALTYVYLDTSSNCPIGANSIGFGANIPLYVITSNLGIESISDVRSMYASGVGLTAPPFAADLVAKCHAKCDGSTDDHVAIQACLDSNPAVMIPPSVGGVTECMTGTVGITLCSSTNKSGYNAFYGRGQLLGYTGSGSMITISNACDPSDPADPLGMNRIEDLYIDAHAATGTPTMIKSVDSWHLVLNNVDDEAYTTLDPTTFTSLDINNSASGGAEGFAISNFLGGGHLTIEGGSGGTSAFSITASQFDSVQATNLLTATIDSTIFGDDVTSTIYDSTSLSLSASAFSGPVVVGSIDGGISSIIANNDTFFSTLTATSPTVQGPALFTGTANIFLQTTLPAMVGTYVGHIEGIYDDIPPGPAIQFNEFNGLELPPFYYSVAGTPLPTCNSGLNGVQLAVSDASSPTFLGTYAGSGSTHGPVICNGTAWVTY